jgi:hypothetical protein
MLPSDSHRPKGNHAGCPYPMRAPLQAWHATQCWPKLGTARRRGESSAGFRRPGSRGSMQWLKGKSRVQREPCFLPSNLGASCRFSGPIVGEGPKDSKNQRIPRQEVNKYGCNHPGLWDFKNNKRLYASKHGFKKEVSHRESGTSIIPILFFWSSSKAICLLSIYRSKNAMNRLPPDLHLPKSTCFDGSPPGNPCCRNSDNSYWTRSSGS